MNTPKAARNLLDWYEINKRDLPWRRTRDPYAIWISEIMLQQTRVETVKDYYRRFLARYPDVTALANAPEEDVLKLWEGLGYYSRARNLQRAARTVVEEYGGAFPHEYEEILKLTGIGPYTAGAIASIAFGQAVPAVDGNVIRVATRLFGIREDVAAPSVQREIRRCVAELLPEDAAGAFNQAMMELGATLCSPNAPRCEECPLRLFCSAFEDDDAELLPIHEKKRPAKEMDVAVCLLTYEGCVLVFQRQQRMLRGLYVFDLLEDESEPTRALALLREQGFDAVFDAFLGEARHVFTHRIWNMRLLHFRLNAPPSDALLEALHARLASRAELQALPFPTAMKAAKAQALQIVGNEGR